ncbi:DoxX family protein [Streptomyces sp. NPDC049879]|uniref:DoxX family protein n=1 Tax=Streptomyces sp. NPDC049879 TaxID=3365598 RepID=UPI0037B022A6
MIPFLAMVIGFAVLRLAGLAGVDALDAWQPALRGGVALLFVTGGVPHFLPSWRRDMAAMVPPSLPRPELLVTLTGVLELAGAAGLLIPPLAPYAAIGLAVLLLALFPANVHAARQHLTLGGRPATPLPLRTVLQVVFLAATVACAL